MDLDLTGKTALVTGSTAGIGLATAIGLAECGATVWVNGRTRARVDHAITAIRQRCPPATLLAAVGDVASPEGAKSVTDAIESVDILVNNVGGIGGERKPFEQLDEADWLAIYQLNVMSAVRMTRHFLPAMRARNWGRLIYVSSESGVQIPTEFLHYGVVKAGVIALARGIAETLVACGVTANSVLPGPTFAESFSRFAAAEGKTEQELAADVFAHVRPTSLLKRFATTEEVANMIVYLCSRAASATHGAAVRVDGGVIKSAF
jgi:NAD(P)-dependent dehydrogenase (short-subunit alcohol dehydrogenase family)